MNHKLHQIVSELSKGSRNNQGRIGILFWMLILLYSLSQNVSAQINFNTKVDFVTGTRPYGIAVGDLDGDGKLDLAVANHGSGTVSVLRNTSTSGTISFAAKVDFATGITSWGVAIGELDGDGKLDLAVTNYNNQTVSVLRNTSTSGTISFATKVDFAVGFGPTSIVMGDLDGDLKFDLAITNSGSNTLSVLRNMSTTGTISFAPKVDFGAGANTYDLTTGDVDGDGKLDLVVANANSVTVSVFRNTSTSGTISFAPKVDFAAGANPNGVAMGDLDGDGKPDLVIANSTTASNTVWVQRNTSTSGTISFTPKVDFITGVQPHGLVIGDLDADGKPDLTVTNASGNTVSVLQNTSTSGTISFAPKVDFGVGTDSYRVAIGDVDGDGKPDLAVTNYGSNTVSVLLNTTSGGCLPPPSGMVAWWPLDDTSGTTVADIVGGFTGTAQPGPIGAFTGPGPVTSASWPPPTFPVGKVSTSLFFYGNRRVEVPHNTALDPGSGDFTIDTWVIYAAAGNGQLLTIARKGQPAIQGPGWGFLIRDYSATQGGLAFYAGQFGGSVEETITPNTWHHVSATLSTGASGLRIVRVYVDGVSSGQIGLSGNIASTANLLIGGDGVLAGEIAVDEVEIFNRALDSTEVRNIWAADSLGKCKPVTGSIQGYKFNDLNGNCVKDSLEQGLSDWTINLSGSGLSFSITTDSLGQYYFTSLPAGTYTVSEVPQTGWTQTCPAPPGTYTVNLAAGQQVTGINFGNKADSCSTDTLLINTGYNHAANNVYAISSFDNYWTVVGQPPSFGGGLPRPANVISPYSSWDGPLANSQWLGAHPAAVNNDSGVYVFEYKFCVGDTTGTRLSMQMLVDDDGVVYLNGNLIGQTPANPFPCTSSGPNKCNFLLPATTISTTNSAFFVLGTNTLRVEVTNRWGVAMGLNISGYVTAQGISLTRQICCDPTGALGGFKWNDLNGDGIWQANEPKLANWPIQLSNGMTDTTDQFGYYFFTSVPPGSYTVTETQQAGWVQTYPLAPGSHSVTLAVNQTIGNLNFGNRSTGRNHYKTWRVEPQTFDRIVFVQDQFMRDNLRLVGIEFLSNPVKKTHRGTIYDIVRPNDHLTWYRAEGKDTLLTLNYVNQFESTAVDIDSVKYLLLPTQKMPHDWPEGLDHYKAYRIVNPKEFAVQITLEDQFDIRYGEPERIECLFTPRYFLTPALKDKQFTMFDSVTHYVAYEMLFKRSYPLQVQTIDQFGNHGLSVLNSEFLLVPTDKQSVVTGSIQGYKFNDLNANCVKDSLEQGLPGWTINLSGSGLSLSTTTDSLGQYSFGSLPAGTYTVSEVLQTGWTQTCPLPLPPGAYTVNLGAGQQVTGIIFGNRQLQDTTGCLNPPPSGMVSWWPLDETSGTIAADIAGGGNDGNHVGSPTPVPGMVDGALRFNGTNRVVIPSAANLNITEAITVDAWVRQHSVQSNGPVYVTNMSAAGQGYTLGGDTTGRVRWLVGTTSGFHSLVSKVFIADSQWHFLVATYDSGTGQAQIFVDGALDTTDTFGGPIAYSPGIEPALGATAGGTNAFQGDLDEVEIYDTVLTPAEIMSIFLVGSAGKCKPTPTEQCEGNIIQNWSFINGAVPGAMPSPGQVSNWSVAYRTPDVALAGGCGDSAYVGMWGNQVVGEALQQTLATSFVQGGTYSISFCARWNPEPGRPYPVQFAFRASNVSLTGPQDPNGVLIGVSQPITSQQNWVTVTLPYWTATGTFSILTISATNQSSFNHGDSTSYGHIDRICIRRDTTCVTNWSALGSGMNFRVQSLAAIGTNLYAGGVFTTAGGVSANRIAKWNGSSWSPLGSGMNDEVVALAVIGTHLYAGGGFITAGGVGANRTAKWDGTSWSALGSGMNNGVWSLAVIGTDLYAGGVFTTAGGVSANRIAKWIGSSWSALGSGINGEVWALAVIGTDLYAGGNFTTAGGVPANYVAKWNGSSWSPLGSGMNDGVFALSVIGTDLYAGGNFTTAGGVSANRIAKWDGASWSALGGGIDANVEALAVIGTDIYAGGVFFTAGGVSANRIAKWDGASWSTLGSGVNDRVNALAVIGADLYAGGQFTTAGGVSANYVARWGCTSIPVSVGEDRTGDALPQRFLLEQSYPNPFNPTTTIEYHVPVSSFVKLSVFDILGREIAILVNELKPVGKHRVTFDASGLAGGVYFYRMQAGQFQETRKLVLLR